MKNNKMFTLVELMASIVIVTLLVSLIVPALKNAGRSSRGVQCAANQHHLYLTGMQIAEAPMDFFATSNAGTYTFTEWTGMFAQLQPDIAKNLLCPEDDRPTFQMTAENYRFHTTWQNGYDIKLEPSVRARVYEVFSNPTGWRIGLEDWNDWDYSDLVVDILIHPDRIEVKTVSADTSGDVNFVFVSGKMLITSLKSQIGVGISLPTGSPSSYGINGDLECFKLDRLARDIPAQKVFLADYPQKVVYADTDDWTQWLGEGGVYDFDRHAQKANVAFCDGSVKNLKAGTIDPYAADNLAGYWQIKDNFSSLVASAWADYGNGGATSGTTTGTGTTTTTANENGNGNGNGKGISLTKLIQKK